MELSIYLRLYKFLLPILLLSKALPIFAQELQSEPADNPPPLLSSEQPQVDGTQEISQPTKDYSILWRGVIRSIETRDFSAANTSLNELEQLQIKAGHTILEDYSKQLLLFAEKELKAGSKENAAFLVRRAIKLSPISPIVHLNALHVADVTKVSSPLQTFWSIARSTWARYDQIILLLIKLVYPVLWALTFGALISLLYVFVANISAAMRSLAMILPSSIRGLVAPALLVMLLVAPLTLGPIVTVWAWAALALLLLPAQRWFAACCALVIVLWGVIIPIRENFNVWLSDCGIQSMLRVSSAVFTPEDANLLPLLTNARPLDAAAWYARGQVLRRTSDYANSDNAFMTARRLSADDRRIQAQLGLNEFLKGDAAKADQIFKELHTQGMRSAEFLFNYSKIRFDLMDTEESRVLFEEANAKDNEKMTLLRSKEELLGMNSPIAVGEMVVPFRDILNSALSPMEGAVTNSDQIADQLVANARPSTLVWSGAALFLIFIIIGSQKTQKRTIIYYRSYKCPKIFSSLLRLLPGGAAALQAQGLRSLLQCSLLVFLVMPIIKWPYDMFSLLEQMRGLRLYYAYFVFFVFASLSYIGFYAYDEDSTCKQA